MNLPITVTQGATPNIPSPSYMLQEKELESRTFGVVIDPSGFICSAQIGLALGAFAASRESTLIPLEIEIFPSE